MNLQQAEILLEKINRLFKSMKMDAENISRIEKDLMINYIRDYYELFIPDDAAPMETTPKTRKQTQVPAREEVPVQKYVRKNAVIDPEFDAIPEEEPEVVVPVVKKQPTRIVREERPVVQPEPEPIQPPVVRQPRTEPAHTPVSTPVSSPASSDEHDLIFREQTTKDLSDRLKSLPIKDLSKAFSINDRILTQNNLFDGDTLGFNVTLEEINKLNSFEEAKDYLSKKVIDKYGWTSKAKLKAAQGFVQLVGRRFK